MSDTETAQATTPVEKAEFDITENVAPAKEEVVPTTVTTTPVTPSDTKKTVFSIIKANPLFPRVSELVHWRDPVKSGLVFGIITCSYILLGWLDYSVLTLISYLLLALLAVCFTYATFVHLKSTWLQGHAAANPFVQNFEKVDFHVSKADAEPHLNTILDLANLAIDTFTSVFFITNRILSLKYIAYFYLLAILGEWFSGLTLAYTTVLVAFVWPRLYEEKKKEIDHGFELAYGEYKKYSAVAISKLPPVVREYAGLVDKKRD